MLFPELSTRTLATYCRELGEVNSTSAILSHQSMTIWRLRRAGMPDSAGAWETSPCHLVYTNTSLIWTWPRSSQRRHAMLRGSSPTIACQPHGAHQTGGSAAKATPLEEHQARFKTCIRNIFGYDSPGKRSDGSSIPKKSTAFDSPLSTRLTVMSVVGITPRP